MYNLIEYSKNYRKTTGILWNHYRYEDNNSPADNYNADPITNSALFKYKSNITGKTPNNDNDVIIVPLKYLGNFWRPLVMPLINCEINLNLTWSENYTLTDIKIQAVVPAQRDNPAIPAINAPTNVTIKITHAKLYVPVVTLSN